MRGCRDEYSESAEKQRALEKDLATLREQSELKQGELTKEVEKLQKDIETARRALAAQSKEAQQATADLEQIRTELIEEKKKKAKSPPPAKPAKDTKPERKKGTSPLGQIDLDEGPDSKPISEQLAAALRVHATRVLDLVCGTCLEPRCCCELRSGTL